MDQLELEKIRIELNLLKGEMRQNINEELFKKKKNDVFQIKRRKDYRLIENEDNEIGLQKLEQKIFQNQQDQVEMEEEQKGMKKFTHKN